MDYILQLPFDEGVELILYAIEREKEKFDLLNWAVSGAALGGVSFSDFTENKTVTTENLSKAQILNNVEKMMNSFEGVSLSGDI
jgi:galactokinase/mevalonate kinase-like predicted kinase